MQDDKLFVSAPRLYETLSELSLEPPQTPSKRLQLRDPFVNLTQFPLNEQPKFRIQRGAATFFCGGNQVTDFG